MFCTQCGKQVDTGAVTCPYCGQAVELVTQSEDEERLGVWNTFASFTPPVFRYEYPFDLYLTARRLVAIRTGVGDIKKPVIRSSPLT